MTLELFRPASDRDPALPVRVPCISLWEPYASLVIAGIKTIETRTWAWPYEPGWLVIHRAKRLVRSVARFYSTKVHRAYKATGIDCYDGGGAAQGLVFVTGCRRLVPADVEAACVNYKYKLWAWPLEHARQFAKPLQMPGPRKFVYLPRETVLAHLEGT